jgi:hypothetical protein
MSGQKAERRLGTIGASIALALMLVLSPSQAFADSSNTATGQDALANVTSGVANTADGSSALNADTTGSSNTGVGINALEHNNADYNTAIGTDALANMEDGTKNTATGEGALLQAKHGDNNTADGEQALAQNNGGCDNTATGATALYWNIDACGNTADGFEALHNSDYGSDNTAVGQDALYSTTGTANTSAGSQDTAVGENALTFNSTGQDNTALGFDAGAPLNVSLNATGGLDTYLGAASGPGANNLTNATAIGANATVSESNALVLGGTGVKVGIGTSTPSYTLDVIGTIHTTNTIQGDISGSAASFRGNLAGDVTGTQSATSVAQLQGYTLDLSTAPTTNQLLLYNGSKWVAGDVPGGSNHYIQNGTSQQGNANFNIAGSGTLGGTLLAARAGIGTASAPNSLLQIGKPSTTYGSYLQLPLVTSSSAPPASDCNTSTYVGRIVLQYTPTGSSTTTQVTLWVCLPTGRWSSH